VYVHTYMHTYTHTYTIHGNAAVGADCFMCVIIWRAKESAGMMPDSASAFWGMAGRVDVGGRDVSQQHGPMARGRGAEAPRVQ